MTSNKEPKKSFNALMNDPEILLELAPEELSGYLLEHLILRSNDGANNISRSNFFLERKILYPQTSGNEDVKRALMEAWTWLEREGFIAPDPDSDGWMFVTRRATRLKNYADFKALQKKDLLPRRSLHPVIAQEIWSTFLRGKYDTAIFEAFKIIEMEVRKKGKFSDKDHGAGLMNKAFNEHTGPLRGSDKIQMNEKMAVKNLFEGAIGYCRNPSVHRSVISDPFIAVEMISLASHLMRILDSRKCRRKSKKSQNK